MLPALLVVVEGSDGSGKTRQTDAVVDALCARGCRIDREEPMSRAAIYLRVSTDEQIFSGAIAPRRCASEGSCRCGRVAYRRIAPSPS